MASYDEISRQSRQIISRIMEYTGVPEHIVSHILCYTKTITSPLRPDAVSRLVFLAQMGLRFGITSKYHAQLMFEALRIPKTQYISIEEYTKAVCIFFSKDIDVKINFVFKTYNVNGSGFISQTDVSQLLSSCIVSSYGDDDQLEQLKDLVDVIMNATDTDLDGYISFDEFRNYVNNDILCLEIFGKVLPSPDALKGFKLDLLSRTSKEIKKFFEDELTKMLGVPNRESEPMDKYYDGVHLDMP